MDNIYGLKENDEVVIINHDTALPNIKEFEIDESKYIKFIKDNHGVVFTVKQIFGNRILLSNNKFVFDFNIKPNKEVYVVFSNIRNVIRFSIPDKNYDEIKDILEKHKIKFEYGYGFGITNDGLLILPYKKELFDYNTVKKTLNGWLQVQDIKNEISKIF